MNYERVAATLQQRFAEQVSRYEGDLAMLREQATEQIEALSAERDELQNRVSQLEAELAELKPAEKPNVVSEED